MRPGIGKQRVLNIRITLVWRMVHTPKRWQERAGLGFLSMWCYIPYARFAFEIVNCILGEIFFARSAILYVVFENHSIRSQHLIVLHNFALTSIDPFINADALYTYWPYICSQVNVNHTRTIHLRDATYIHINYKRSNSCEMKSFHSIFNG